MKFALFFTLLLFIGVLSQTEIWLSYHEHGVVQENGYVQYYLPSIPELSATNKLTFVAWPMSGDVELYVSTTSNATRQNNNWKSTHSGPNFVSVSKSTPGYTRGPYWVSCYGVWTSTLKVIAYIDDGDEIIIDNEEPQVASIDAGKWLYFKYNLKENKTFGLGVTPVTGDPDIYVDTRGKPTFEKNQWRSLAIGADVLTIKNTEPNFHVGIYYIGIRGYTNTLFQIAATTLDGTEILSEGLPHAKEVYTSGQQYFEYQLAAYKNFWVEVRPRTAGNQPNLCISATVKKPREEDGTCTWRIYGWSGIAYTEILREDPNYKNGTYYIGVSGWPRDWQQQRVRFTVTAATRLRSVLLLDGVPFNTRADPNTYTYFRIYHGWNKQRLQLEAEIQSGYVELYASNDPTNTHPTKDQYDFVSSFRGSTSTIVLNEGAKEGWYYIGALSYGSSNFTMRGTTNATATVLKKGENLYYFGLPYNFYKYYTYDISREIVDLQDDVTIALHFYQGDGSIVVGTEPRPTWENAKWKSWWTQLTITAKDLREAKATTLYIGVKGEDTVNAFFSILLFMSNQPIQLLPGRVYEGRVLYNQYMNYVYRNYQGGRLRMSLTVTNNRDDNRDCDMYVDTQPNPNSQRYQYRSSWWGPKTIIVRDSYPETNYYISVQGTSTNRNTTRYSLKVSFDYETLQDGAKPFPDDVDAKQYRIYQVRVPSWAERFMVSTTLINGYTEMYMLEDESEPNRNNYTFADQNWPGNVIYMDKKNPKWKAGTWTIAVYGAENSDYFISASSDWAELTAGIPITGSATNLDSVYYWGLIDPTKNVYFSVKIFDLVCMRIYASQTNDKPGNGTSDWRGRSNALMQNQISMTIPSSELDQTMPWIYIGMTACRTTPNFMRFTFELTMNYQGQPNYLAQEVNALYQMDAANGQNPWFVVNSYNHATGFNFILESCTYRNVEVVYGTTNDTTEFPIGPRRAEFSSTPYNKYSQQINLQGTKYANKQILVSVSQPMANMYSIFSNTKDKDTRPIQTSVKQHFAKRFDQDGKTFDRYSIDIPAVASDYYPVFYEVIALDDTIPGINMYTVCGVRNTNSSRLLKTFDVMTPQAQSFQVDLDIAKNHYVVVVFTDWFYRTSTSNLLYMPVMERRVDHPLPVSFGAFLILLVSILIVLYLIVGMTIKKIIYKSSGLELIPNIAFWKDTPFLFVDGIKFVFTCGKRSTGAYTETVGDSTVPTSQKDETNPFGTSGYGTL